MGLRYLEHLLIMTHDPDATRDWFCHNLGMREGPHPEFGFPVHWLYIGERDVVHIAQARQSAQQDAYLGRPGGPGADPAPAVAGAPSVADGAKPAPEDAMGSGRIDHICFNCEGLHEFLERFERNGVAFTERKARDSDLYQVFAIEPVNGLKVELNFDWREAARAGRVPGWTDEGENTRPASEVRVGEGESIAASRFEPR